MKRILLAAALALAAFAAPAWADKDVNPREARPGAWVHIGTVTANYSSDHDTIDIHGNDNFRRLRFHVKDAPLRIHRMVVTYESGLPDLIDVKEVVREGKNSRSIDLRGVGTRSIRRIDFWFETIGKFRGKADVSVFGQR